MEEHTEHHPDIHELIAALSGFISPDISPDQASKLVSRLPDEPERPATKLDVEAAIDGLRNHHRRRPADPRHDRRGARHRCRGRRHP